MIVGQYLTIYLLTNLANILNPTLGLSQLQKPESSNNFERTSLMKNKEVLTQRGGTSNNKKNTYPISDTAKNKYEKQKSFGEIANAFEATKKKLKTHLNKNRVYNRNGSATLAIDTDGMGQSLGHQTTKDNNIPEKKFENLKLPKFKNKLEDNCHQLSKKYKNIQNLSQKH